LTIDNTAPNPNDGNQLVCAQNLQLKHAII
jgi:hypothetical protein